MKHGCHEIGTAVKHNQQERILEDLVKEVSWYLFKKRAINSSAKDWLYYFQYFYMCVLQYLSYDAKGPSLPHVLAAP